MGKSNDARVSAAPRPREVSPMLENGDPEPNGDPAELLESRFCRATPGSSHFHTSRYHVSRRTHSPLWADKAASPSPEPIIYVPSLSTMYLRGTNASTNVGLATHHDLPIASYCSR